MSIFEIVNTYLFDPQNIPRLLEYLTIHPIYALLLVLLAGISLSIGQSFVLIVNRVVGIRMVASLLIEAVLFVFSYLFWLLVLLITMKVSGIQVSLVELNAIVTLTHIPLFFSFLSFMPYLGEPILLLLRLLSFLSLIRILRSTYDLPFIGTFVIMILAFVAISYLRSTIGRPIEKLAQIIQNATAGKKVQSFPDIMGRVVDEHRKQS